MAARSNLPARAPTWRNLAQRAIGLVRAEITAWRQHRSGNAPQKRYAYAGAAMTRLTEDWVFAPIQSANQDIRGDHRALVARARELARNDSIVRRYISLTSQNVIGPDGITLRCCVKGADDEFDRPINRRIEEAFARWCAVENASTDGQHSFPDIEHRLVEDWKRDGEGLARMIFGFDNEFGFALQLLDPDQLDVEFNQARGHTGNEIRMGVELNQWNRPVAYWLWSTHPAEPQRRIRERIPAEQIIHLFRPERAGQVRGVTRIATVMTKINALRGYEEAELVAARTGASKMGFFTLADAETLSSVAEVRLQPSGFQPDRIRVLRRWDLRSLECILFDDDAPALDEAEYHAERALVQRAQNAAAQWTEEGLDG